MVLLSHKVHNIKISSNSFARNILHQLLMSNFGIFETIFYYLGLMKFWVITGYNSLSNYMYLNKEW